MSHFRTLAALALLGASGCAERQLVTQPRSAPTGATWTAVTVAAAIAALVLGVLLTLPAWRTRSGARLAVAVLTAHAGAVALGGAVLVATAVRSWQLIEHPAESAAEPALVRLSAVDGDTGFFALMVLVVVVVTALVAFLLALAARWAATEDPLGRAIACGVLGLLLLVSAGAAVALVLGSEAWPYVTLTASAPLTAAALVTAWPRRRPA